MIKKVLVITISIGLVLSATACKNEKAATVEKTIIKPNDFTVPMVIANEVKDEQVTELTHTEPKKEKPPAEKAEVTVLESKPSTPQPITEENDKKRELSFLDNENRMESEIVPTTPQVVNASAEDSKEIAEKVLEYINSNRTVSAVSLEGLTKYAEYRSRQLISRFAHNTEDERAAATALQYGEYVEPSLYGMDGEPYYTSCSREAIAKAGYTGTVDEIAQRFANLIKNSVKHWCYVGSDEYSYIGIGVTYESGMWYCDVALAKENTDEK